jgi:K+-sensing histidine kinase KdpD
MRLTKDIKFCESICNLFFFELIDNALKFSEDNKIIMVSGTTYNEEFYELIIKDFGIGFSENELNKIGATTVQ